MKKVYLILGLALVIMSSSAFAASFGGFNMGMVIATVKDVTIAGGPATMNTTTGIASINYSVNCNYDGWVLAAFGPGMVNASQANHTLPLQVATVTKGAAAPSSYAALVDSPNTVTLTNGGSYTATPAQYDLYMKTTALATAKAGYYGAYINLKFTDNY